MSLTKLSLARFNHITYMNIENTLIRKHFGDNESVRSNIQAIELWITSTGRIATVMVFPGRNIQTPSPRRIGFPLQGEEWCLMRSVRNPVRGNFETTYNDSRGYPKVLGQVSAKRLTECIGIKPFEPGTIHKLLSMVRVFGTRQQDQLEIIHQVPFADAMATVPVDLIDPWSLGMPLRVGGITFFSPKYVLDQAVQQTVKHAYIGGMIWENQIIIWDFNKYSKGRTMFLSDKVIPEASMIRLTRHLESALPVFQNISKRLAQGAADGVFIGQHEVTFGKRVRHE